MHEHSGGVSFERDIKPLFTEMDVDHMEPMGVALDDYGWMSKQENAQIVHDYLSGAKEPQMPPGGPYWSAEQLETLSRWIAEGRKP